MGPQCEDGYTAIANELLEALCRIRIPGESTQVFLTILRKTYGYKKVVDQISLSQFVAATGMKKPNICRALKQLETLNVIRIDKLVDQNDNTSRVMYRINKHYDTWEVEKRKQTRPEPLSKRIITVVQNDNESLSKTITNVIQNDTHKRKKENTKERKKTYAAFLSEKIADCFELFYEDYPRKERKKEARKFYLASVKTHEDMGKIGSALDAYIAQCKKRDRQFIMQAGTWFNNWQDYVGNDWQEIAADFKTKVEAEYEDYQRKEDGTGADDQGLL